MIIKETKDVYTKKSIAAGDKHICRRCGGDTLGGLVPCICEYHDSVKFESGAWFLRQVQRALSLMPWSLSTDKLEQIDEECEGTSDNRDLRHVREFLEAISSKLAGGPLEGIRVAPLYDHPAYVEMFERHHAVLRETLATLSTTLREAITRKLLITQCTGGFCALCNQLNSKHFVNHALIDLHENSMLHFSCLLMGHANLMLRNYH
ncbi:unnamed protein product [Pieris macdunnoughi]|uniref:Uncharacterized protein n=1 Tax=Pieris macdunnoughi TaxID=345717 RepID=A0A821XZY1_9NEOP|nr:unnamed protein product [Pieris macdunnoughi]